MTRPQLISFILEASESQPAARRASILTALADMVGNEQEARHLTIAADQLRQADRYAREFAFTFNTTKS